MAEQPTRCRGIGALAALWDRARQAEGKAPAGLRVLVDLDEGTVTRAIWNESGFEAAAESWQGQGVLDRLLQAIGPFFDGDSVSARASLLDAKVMSEFTESVNDALFDDLDEATIELNGHTRGFRQLFTNMGSLSDAVREMAGQACAFHSDAEEDIGSLILYGTCAAFKPLQILFRNAFHESDLDSFLPLAAMEDSLFDYVSDDGSLAREGWDLLDAGTVSSGPPTAPVDLAILLTDENGKDVSFPLAAKGQSEDQFSPGSPAFFLAPGTDLRLTASESVREVPLPESFLRSGCVAVARARLENRSLTLCLTDASDHNIIHSLSIDTEVV